MRLRYNIVLSVDELRKRRRKSPPAFVWVHLERLIDLRPVLRARPAGWLMTWDVWDEYEAEYAVPLWSQTILGVPAWVTSPREVARLRQAMWPPEPHS